MFLPVHVSFNDLNISGNGWKKCVVFIQSVSKLGAKKLIGFLLNLPISVYFG